MKRNSASWSAEMVAIFRAVESMKPLGERVCYDAYAKDFISPKFKFVLHHKPLKKMVIWYAIDRRGYYGSLGTIAFRARFIDDCLNECIDNGIEQLVILGAGYDTRAYRFHELKEQGRVFEVDHPTTQKEKINKVKSIFGSLPAHVTYSPIDFEKEKLDTILFESGYEKNLKTLFIWEGVSYYVSKETVNDTLSFVANNACKGSSIVFDYIFRSVIDGSSNLEVAKKILNYQAKSGEPLIFGIQEGGAEKFLHDKGFSQVKDVTPQSLKSTYFKGKNTKIKTYPFWGFVHAIL